MNYPRWLVVFCLFIITLGFQNCGQEFQSKLSRLSQTDLPLSDSELEVCSASLKEELASLKSEDLFRINTSYDVYLNTIYYREAIIPEADICSFQALNYIAAKDNNHVYYANQIIEEADPETFEILNDCFFKDNKQVYYCVDRSHIEVFSGLEPESISVLGDRLITNGSQLYTSLGVVEDPIIDIATMQRLNEYVLADESHVYAMTGSDIIPLVVADGLLPSALQLIGGPFFADNQNVYIYSPQHGDVRVVDGADPNEAEHLGGQFLRSGDMIFNGASPHFIDIIDPSTFELLGMLYARDSSAVYQINLGVIEGADPETFRVVSFYLAYDQNNYYSYSSAISVPVSGVEPRHVFSVYWDIGGFLYQEVEAGILEDYVLSEFVPLGFKFHKSNRAVYNGTILLEGMSLEVTHALNFRYLKSATQVFYYGLVNEVETLIGVDIPSFETIGVFTGK